MNFAVNLIFLIKPLFLHDQKVMFSSFLKGFFSDFFRHNFFSDFDVVTKVNVQIIGAETEIY